MTYIIKIQDKTAKAKSIINMLKALNEDYDFIEIIEDNVKQNKTAVDKELDKRYKSFLKNKNGKTWDELKNELNK